MGGSSLVLIATESWAGPGVVHIFPTCNTWGTYKSLVPRVTHQYCLYWGTFKSLVMKVKKVEERFEEKYDSNLVHPRPPFWIVYLFT